MDQPGLLVQDVVYGTFCLPSCIRAAVESEEFLRLKRLKQLGVANLIFDGAHHTRCEHSLGACYLAGKLLDALALHLEQPISPEDRMCVMLAAVLHDVGHGPFSHMWEKFVDVYDGHWRHEEASDHLVRKILGRMESITETQTELICAMILGKASELLTPERRFLAHIVSSDVDVDRCDYLQRDSHHVPNIIRPSRPFREMFERARVATVRGKSVIAYHWEDFPLVYEMAAARQQFHRSCYQDSSVLGVELMMLDVLHEAERAGFRFSRNGKSESLSNVHSQPDLFKYLDDSIVDELEYSNHPGLETTKEIIRRLKRGERYIEIFRSPIDLTNEVRRYNALQGKPIAVQASRCVKSTEQWFAGYNVTFYKPTFDGRIEIVSTDKARGLSKMELEMPKAKGIEEYIIYCTSAVLQVQQSTKNYFVYLNNSPAVDGS
uniref:HD domain-containing protein n=1 Tax=Anopheles atroparvus TaxID=41427 RepID=A0AAG5D6W0_ANOAO